MKIVDKLMPSLQARLMTALILPLLILCVVLTSYMAIVRHHDLTDRLISIAEKSSLYLADSAGFALFSGDTEQLRSLATSAMKAEEISAVTFFDRNQAVVLTIGRSNWFSTDFAALKPEGITRLHDDWWMVYRAVEAAGVSADDFAEVEAPRLYFGNVLVELDNRILLQRQSESLFDILIVSVLVLVLAILGAIQISYSISRPLKKLTEAVSQVEKGNYDAVIPNQGPRELALLAEVLSRQIANTRNYSSRLERDVEKATEQLLAAMNDLEEAMIAKDQFMAKMSHELRTPLTAVIGFTAALADESQRSKREEYQRIIASSSRLLLKTIDDVLEFARSSSSELSLADGEVCLRETLSDVVAIYSASAQVQDIQLKTVVDEELPEQLWGDSVRVAQIFNNLIGNALKFTHRGEITVSVARGEQSLPGFQQLVCRVKDTGKGIAPARIRHLYSPFAQEDDSISRQFGGSGLGLAICRSLVELMKGEINIESVEGEGTTVSFTLQLALADTSSALIHCHDALMFVGKRLLVAEDHPYNQQLLQRMLAETGAEVVTVENGAMVLDQLNQSDFDLLLMDIHMPIMDGVQTARAIANRPLDSPIIVGLTADVNSSEHLAMKAAGATQVLVKPIERDLLLNTLAGLLGKTERVEVGQGLLAAGGVPSELIDTLLETLATLRVALHGKDHAALRSALHDLMGLSGLYGMSELRQQVLSLRQNLTDLDSEEIEVCIEKMSLVIISASSSPQDRLR